MRPTTRIGWLIVLAVIGTAPLSARAAVPTVDNLALAMLDSEALYTLTDGLKPVSEGFWRTRFAEEQPTSPEVETVRARLQSLPLGPNLEAGVFVFARASGGKRSASAFVAHKPSLRALIERRRDVFEPLGVTPQTAPQKVMEAIDRAAQGARWRAFGLVFGYPEYAVEFFVTAGEQQLKTGKFVQRDFVNLPTFVSDRGRFVYAVPKGHVERDEDRYLKAATTQIFTRYRAWRQVYLEEQNLDAVTLLSSWLAPAVFYAPSRVPTYLPSCHGTGAGLIRMNSTYLHRGRCGRW
jgi:hypothetical protein